MAGLDDIVRVNITAEGGGISQPGFGIACIVGAHSRFPERIRYYGTTEAMIEDGFLPTDPEYIAASKLKAQNPSPAQFAVGRRANAPTMQFRVTPIARDHSEYRIAVGNDEAIFTSGAAASVAEIVEGLVSAIGTVDGW